MWIDSTACRRSSSGKYSQDSRRYAASRRFKNWWKTYSVNLSSSTTGSSSRQCTTTLYGEKKETQNGVITIQRLFRIMLANSLGVIRLSWGLGQKRNGTEPTLVNPTDPGTTAEQMMMNFSEHGHPIFRASSVLERGELRNKGGRKKSIHNNGSEENIQLLLRTVICANQLSVYGAVADLCNNFPKIFGF